MTTIKCNKIIATNINANLNLKNWKHKLLYFTQMCNITRINVHAIYSINFSCNNELQASHLRLLWKKIKVKYFRKIMNEWYKNTIFILKIFITCSYIQQKQILCKQALSERGRGNSAVKFKVCEAPEFHGEVQELFSLSWTQLNFDKASDFSYIINTIKIKHWYRKCPLKRFWSIDKSYLNIKPN